MPIYMDRHDVSETVTAENVAHLHQQDLKIQDQFNCRGLTYWFDDKRKTAFCLVEAPDKQSLQAMHNHAHGEVPNNIIEVEPAIVESFLGRIEDPVKAQNTSLNIINDPAFRIIMIVQLKINSPQSIHSRNIKSTFYQYKNAVLTILSNYNEQPVKQSDDQLLISFKSVSDALHAALDIQGIFNQYKKETADEIAGVKIGLSAGVPVTEKQSIFEDSIRLAERMCEMVQGEIIISAEVKDLYKSENANASLTGKNIFALTSDDEIFLNDLIDYTEKNWRNPDLKVNDFTKPLASSKSQLYRKIVFLTGKSPNSFIKEYRLSAAINLLNKSFGNISEIAFETGFTSASYFSKCFLKRYGHLPSDYLQARMPHQIEA